MEGCQFYSGIMDFAWHPYTYGSMYQVAMGFSIAWKRGYAKQTNSRAPTNNSWLPSIHSGSNVLVNFNIDKDQEFLGNLQLATKRLVFCYLILIFPKTD